MKNIEVLFMILSPSGTVTSEILHDFMQTILCVIYPKDTIEIQEIDELNKKIFGDISKLNMKDCFYQINSLFPSINKILGIKFRHLLFDKATYLSVPQLTFTQPSKIIKNRLNSLVLPLMFPQISPSAKFYKLYIASDDGFSFTKLANCLKFYSANFIILFRHNSGPKENIFGVFNEGEAKEGLKYVSGNVGNSIFELSPQLFAARTYSSKGDHNYCYFNTRHIENSDYKRGLGFGGNLKKARLWIDGDFPNDCYLESRDDTYEIKQFLESPELYITELEIWGLGNELNLAQQEESRQIEVKMAENDRKVDKKAFLEGDFNKEFLFEKTFGYKQDSH